MVIRNALIGFRGLMLPDCPRRTAPSLRPLKKKGCKEESMTKVGLDAIGTSTPLESNKSLEKKASRDPLQRGGV
jgi:hypothetical protein